MSDIKHTVAPWRVENGTTLIWGDCNPDNLTTYGMGYPIAECRLTPAASWAKGPRKYEEAQANARLIAAAPDLLSALEDSVALLEAIKEHWIDYDQVFSSGVHDAKAAIAKATGAARSSSTEGE